VNETSLQKQRQTPALASNGQDILGASETHSVNALKFLRSSRWDAR